MLISTLLIAPQSARSCCSGCWINEMPCRPCGYRAKHAAGLQRREFLTANHSHTHTHILTNTCISQLCALAALDYAHPLVQMSTHTSMLLYFWGPLQLQLPSLSKSATSLKMTKLTIWSLNTTQLHDKNEDQLTFNQVWTQTCIYTVYLILMFSLGSWRPQVLNVHQWHIYHINVLIIVRMMCVHMCNTLTRKSEIITITSPHLSFISSFRSVERNRNKN